MICHSVCLWACSIGLLRWVGMEGEAGSCSGIDGWNRSTPPTAYEGYPPRILCLSGIRLHVMGGPVGVWIWSPTVIQQLVVLATNASNNLCKVEGCSNVWRLRLHWVLRPFAAYVCSVACWVVLSVSGHGRWPTARALREYRTHDILVVRCFSCCVTYCTAKTRLYKDF